MRTVIDHHIGELVQAIQILKISHSGMLNSNC